MVRKSRKTVSQWDSGMPLVPLKPRESVCAFFFCVQLAFCSCVHHVVLVFVLQSHLSRSSLVIYICSVPGSLNVQVLAVPGGHRLYACVCVCVCLKL